MSIPNPNSKAIFRQPLSERELQERMKDWTPPQKNIPPGFLRFYARYVGAASQGAVLGARVG